MSNQLICEGTYPLPNSRWLRKLLKEVVITCRESMDIKWQKAVNAEPEYIEECKTKLEIGTQVLELSKSGKDIILTRTQWDGLYQILNDISTMGDFFDNDYWKSNRTRLFDAPMRIRNWHSLDKYLDLFKVSEMDPSSRNQWRRCVN